MQDGNIWTSTEITAGIDLAPALVEDDLGAALARRAAQQFVVSQRTGGRAVAVFGPSRYLRQERTLRPAAPLGAPISADG